MTLAGLLSKHVPAHDCVCENTFFLSVKENPYLGKSEPKPTNQKMQHVDCFELLPQEVSCQAGAGLISLHFCPKLIEVGGSVGHLFTCLPHMQQMSALINSFHFI